MDIRKLKLEVKFENEKVIGCVRFFLDKSCLKSLILLDDKGAKTNLSIDFYLNNGFKVINETENQILFSSE